MATKVYAVLFHVPEKNLGTVLSTLSGSSTLVSVTPTEADVEAKLPKAHFYANGKKNKGITGEELALKILGSESKVFEIQEVRNKFMEHGFAHTSAAPYLNKLAREKRIRDLGNKQFCAVGTIIHR